MFFLRFSFEDEEFVHFLLVPEAERKVFWFNYFDKTKNGSKKLVS